MKVFDMETFKSEVSNAKIRVDCDIDQRISRILCSSEKMAAELQETMDQKIAHTICGTMDKYETYVFELVFTDLNEKNDHVTVYISDIEGLSDCQRCIVIQLVKAVMDDIKILFGASAY